MFISQRYYKLLKNNSKIWKFKKSTEEQERAKELKGYINSQKDWKLAVCAPIKMNQKWLATLLGDVNKQKFKLLLVKCNDNKMVQSPYFCVILQLTQTKVANQQKKEKKSKAEKFMVGWPCGWLA